MSFQSDPMDDNRALINISMRRLVKLLVSFQFVYVICFLYSALLVGRTGSLLLQSQPLWRIYFFAP